MYRSKHLWYFAYNESLNKATEFLYRHFSLLKSNAESRLLNLEKAKNEWVSAHDTKEQEEKVAVLKEYTKSIEYRREAFLQRRTFDQNWIELEILKAELEHDNERIAQLKKMQYDSTDACWREVKF